MIRVKRILKDFSIILEDCFGEPVTQNIFDKMYRYAAVSMYRNGFKDGTVVPCINLNVLYDEMTSRVKMTFQTDPDSPLYEVGIG